MISAILVMCVSGVVGPIDTVELPTEGAVVSRHQVARHQMARRQVSRRQVARRQAPLAPVRVATDLPELTLKLKRRQAGVVALKPGQSIEAKLTGPGRLAVVAFQVLDPGKKTASKNVTVQIAADGVGQKAISYRGRLDRRVKLVGARSTSVSNSKSRLIRLLDGEHIVTVSVPKSSTAAVIELQYYPGKSTSMAPVIFAPAAVESMPVADATPMPPDPPPAPDIPLPAPPEAPSGMVGSTVAEGRQPWTDLQKRIENGEVRDGEVGSYNVLTVADANATDTADGGTRVFAHVTSDAPYTFLCDGPGVVTVRIHRLSATSLPVSETLTILENDVLLQSFDLTTEAAESLSVVGNPGVQVATATEYKLNLGPSLSRFTFQPSEAAVDGLAIGYSFAAQQKDVAMSLTLDIGDEFGLGGDLAGGTTITEVTVREKVVKIEVEKVIHVGEERGETVGVAVVAGVAIPTWGGLPAPSVGLEIQWVLPFADGLMALSAEGQGQRHTLLSYGVDAAAVELRSRSFIWVVPARLGPTFRFPVGESVRFAVGARGSFYYLTGESKSRGSERSDSAIAWGAAGIASFELRLGAGWWTVDAGYGWAQAVDMGDAVRGFSPAAVEFGTRFRFVL